MACASAREVFGQRLLSSESPTYHSAGLGFSSLSEVECTKWLKDYLDKGIQFLEDFLICYTSIFLVFRACCSLFADLTYDSFTPDGSAL